MVLLYDVLNGRRNMKRWVLLLSLLAAPLAAQGRGHGPKKEFAVAPDRAVSVTRDVLVHQGYEVVRIETVGNDQVVWYRRGNMGRGKTRWTAIGLCGTGAATGAGAREGARR